MTEFFKLLKTNQFIELRLVDCIKTAVRRTVWIGATQDHPFQEWGTSIFQCAQISIRRLETNAPFSNMDHGRRQRGDAPLRIFIYGADIADRCFSDIFRFFSVTLPSRRGLIVLFFGLFFRYPLPSRKFYCRRLDA